MCVRGGSGWSGVLAADLQNRPFCGEFGRLRGISDDPYGHDEVICHQRMNGGG